MIDSITLSDGRSATGMSARPTSTGLRQASKSLGWLEGTLNYTYIDAANDTDDRPLDAMPASNLNFDLTVFPAGGLRINLFGLAA